MCQAVRLEEFVHIEFRGLGDFWAVQRLEALI